MRNKLIRDSLIRAFGGLGAHVTQRTPQPDVVALIASLRPFDSGVPLIRIGPKGDGGYLVPDDLDGIDYAFSPGVATQSGFESDLAARGMQVFLADYSVDRPPVENARFSFQKKFVGCLTNDTTMTLDAWKEQSAHGHGGDLLLQMDIEGGEFDSLLNASDALLRQFRIVVVELHFLEQLFNRPFFDLVSPLFRKILQHHSVVHIHPNNCCGSVTSRGIEIPRIAEFTFYRNDRFRHRVPRTVFPHPLDSDNTRKRTLPLPECWYR
jgi:hypothetical protein